MPLTSITMVWLPAVRPLVVNSALEAAGRLAAYVSTVATRAPSRSMLAKPQISHGRPIQLTPVPLNVKLALAPEAEV